MIPPHRRWVCVAGLALTITLVLSRMRAQSGRDETAPRLPVIDSLHISPEASSQLQDAMGKHDYIMAEKLLLAEIERDPHSARAARLLTFAGTVYFLNQDYLNAAVAWKKSEAIAPLGSQFRFLLSMAYVRMGHSDWARPVLESLAAQNERILFIPTGSGAWTMTVINTTAPLKISCTPSSWIQAWPGHMTTWGFVITTRIRTTWR